MTACIIVHRSLARAREGEGKLAADDEAEEYPPYEHESRRWAAYVGFLFGRLTDGHFGSSALLLRVPKLVQFCIVDLRPTISLQSFAGSIYHMYLSPSICISLFSLLG